MDTLAFVFYSLFVLLVYFILLSLEVVLTWIVENWDLLGLIVSNVVALFVKPPRRK